MNRIGFIKYLIVIFFFGLHCSLTAQNSEEIVIPGIYAMPETETPIQQSTSTLVGSSVRTDLHKFMGYEILPARYLSMPFDVFIKNNISMYFVDVGFLLLMFFPILFLFPGKIGSEAKNGLLNFSMLILLVFLLVISIPTALLNANNLYSPGEGLAFLDSNPHSGTLGGLSDLINRIALKMYSPLYEIFSGFSGNQDSVTYPILIILFFGLILLINKRFQLHSNSTKSFIFFMMIYSFLWWMFGAGAAWYGIVIFSIPYIFLLKRIQNEALDLKTVRQKKINLLKGANVFLPVCIIWIFLVFTQRTSNYNPANENRGIYIYNIATAEYQAGNIKESKLTDVIFPFGTQFKKIINKDENSKIYTVSTALNFFIEKNDKRVFKDAFLEVFSNILSLVKTKEKVVEALKISGYEYILFDLNLASIDQAPEKTLTKNFTNFLNTLYDNPGVELILTDRTLKMNDSGQVVSGVFPVGSSIVNQGKFALFRIK